jgi:hypothetical protein
MSIGNLYTLNHAKRLTGANRNLITFLIHDRQIPIRTIGKAKCVDDYGLNQLREAIDEYRNKGQLVPA